MSFSFFGYVMIVPFTEDIGPRSGAASAVADFDVVQPMVKGGDGVDEKDTKVTSRNEKILHDSMGRLATL